LPPNAEYSGNRQKRDHNQKSKELGSRAQPYGAQRTITDDGLHHCDLSLQSSGRCGVSKVTQLPAHKRSVSQQSGAICLCRKDNIQRLGGLKLLPTFTALPLAHGAVVPSRCWPSRKFTMELWGAKNCQKVPKPHNSPEVPGLTFQFNQLLQRDHDLCRFRGISTKFWFQ
jgi:hypothetical protein